MIPAIKEIADFWASRVSIRKGSSNTFEIKHVTSPDEYHVNVTNSIYVNAAAQIALEFATDLISELKPQGIAVSEEWQNVQKTCILPMIRIIIFIHSLKDTREMK